MASAHPPGSRGDEWIPVPGSVRFPVELDPPPGFSPAEPETWPEVEGRLEWVRGRLLYMPPCGDRQARTVADLVGTLVAWQRAHTTFVVGTNEAGVRVGEDVRGADAAIWRRADVGPITGRIAKAVPVLVAEVSGLYEKEPALREKAAGYLANGVAIVWIVLTDSLEVVLTTAVGESRRAIGDRLPEHPALPGLAPAVADLFRQITQA
jgi:Uma2 family endonuclease